MDFATTVRVIFTGLWVFVVAWPILYVAYKAVQSNGHFEEEPAESLTAAEIDLIHRSAVSKARHDVEELSKERANVTN